MIFQIIFGISADFDPDKQYLHVQADQKKLPHIVRQPPGLDPEIFDHPIEYIDCYLSFLVFL